MEQGHAEPTITLRLHAHLSHTPLLPEMFGKVPVTINGKRYVATITRDTTDETGTAVDLWMEPDGFGPTGPVLFTLDELVTSHARAVAAELDAAREAR